MRLPHFDYHEPMEMEELSGLLATYREGGAVLGGGTDLLVRMKYGLTAPAHLVSLAGLAIKDISYDPEEGLSVGAGVTLHALAGNPAVREFYPALAEAASMVATRQIRTTATVGGNIFQNTRCFYYNRSRQWGRAVTPCIKRGGEVCHVVQKGRKCLAVYQGDLAAVLIALKGRAVLFPAGPEGDVPLEGLFTGDGKEPFRFSGGCALTALRVPPVRTPLFSRYAKFRIRDGVDYPLAGAAVAVERDGGVVTDIRICLTGVGSSPVPVRGAGDLAKGSHLEPDIIERLGEMAFHASRPVANVEDTPAHRRSMVRAMVKEMLREAGA